MIAMPDEHQGVTIDYRTPAGAPAYFAPDSLQWRIFKNPIALGIGGVAAVLLEFADARIRSGVWDHSTYKADPIGRSKRTGAVALVGTYAAQETARRVIGGVNRMHARVAGTTPGGEAYRALDPELLDWVGATAAYGFAEAYHRFVQPLTPAEKDRYYREGEPLIRLYGVETPLRSEADFFAMLGRLVDRFEPHPIVDEFLGIIESGKAAPAVPRFLHRALARAAVSLLPAEVRDRLRLGARYDLGTTDRLMLKLAGRLADRHRDLSHPAAHAAQRLGLPADFVWRRPEEQQRLLSARDGLTQAA